MRPWLLRRVSAFWPCRPAPDVPALPLPELAGGQRLLRAISPGGRLGPVWFCHSHNLLRPMVWGPPACLGISHHPTNAEAFCLKNKMRPTQHPYTAASGRLTGCSAVHGRERAEGSTQRSRPESQRSPTSVEAPLAWLRLWRLVRGLFQRLVGLQSLPLSHTPWPRSGATPRLPPNQVLPRTHGQPRRVPPMYLLSGFARCDSVASGTL